MTITRSQLKDANFWLGRAEEARAMAAMHSEPNGQNTLLDIADGYDILARDAAWALKPKSEK